MLSHDFPEWTVVYRQVRRWMDAGLFEQAAHDLRIISQLVAERNPQPSATIIDARTMQSPPESGERAGHDGAKKKKGFESVYCRGYAWKSVDGEGDGGE